MTVWDGKLMKENEPSAFVKVFFGVGISIAVVIALGTGALNVAQGIVTRPWALGMVLIGFLFFLGPKLTVMREKKLVSFGTRLMTNRQANFYRLGYFFMGRGLLLAFA